MVPETVDQRVFSCINGDHLIADVDLIDLYLRSPPSEKIKNKNNKITKQEMLSLTLGFLNSKIFHIFRELEGRISGGGASRLKIFELKKIKILNPYTMEKNPRNEVISLTKRLVNKPMNSKEYFSIQKDLDQEILKAIGMEGRYEELQKSVDDLLSRRKK